MDKKELELYERWKRIEKKAFTPEDSSEATKWLSKLLVLFNKLYELDSNFPKIAFEGGKYVYDVFIMPDIHYSFSINRDLSGFSFCFKWDQTSLQFEYDSKYPCEWKYLNELAKENKKIKKKGFEIEKPDLESILYDMIVHPAIHCHIDNDILKEGIPTLHEIRLGMPTTNPFLFLYQVSFQFLSVFAEQKKDKEEQKKDKELKRLTKVIWDNKDKMSISPGLLFSPK